MRNGNAVILGGGRYIQDKDALERVGEETKYYGKKVFIIGGQTALEVSFNRIKESLDSEKIDYHVHTFKGYCSMSQINKISEEAKTYGADIIIGVGGGKCLDTAKSVANTLNLRVITIPTSAATCAAYATLCVLYSDEGEVLGNLFNKREMAAIIVDMDVITQRCPTRMLASGIGDAVAKYPELAYSMEYAPNWEKSVLPANAFNISKSNMELLMQKGYNAVEYVKKHRNSSDVEDVVCTNIAMTGIVSSLASGGKQLAMAHTVYDCTCAHFKEHRAKYLHGELVSAAIPLQMAVNGFSKDSIDGMKGFLRSINVPASLTDIRLEATDKNIETILKYINEKMDLGSEKMVKRVRECIEVIF
ncbi:iron-containing alcohol dehydrogenase family protein [Petroclostridium sp. X23]|uniref:iron-containing alcohol dehydrogenase family protein n=1 Tax=Petroclostridium sp. X23 TaxID=3045146 RepID=UPI0024ADC818|nr:iron-containing alcohol dehydrogenase family protein [Petroclostridium sp. X23]WHH58022.1 iron-containing alcohol dehydrogenase family protein [Petroclostridium sp. X23]